MIRDNDLIKIKFSDKYKRGLRNDKIKILLLTSPAFIILLFLQVSIKFLLMMLPIWIIITLIFLLARLAGEGKLPIKVKINNNGIFAWKRNKKEEFISWNKVYKIRVMDNITPEDYIVIINKKGNNQRPNELKLEYDELALDYNAAQIAIAKFNEYKAKKGNM